MKGGLSAARCGYKVRFLEEELSRLGPLGFPWYIPTAGAKPGTPTSFPRSAENPAL